MPPTGQRLVLGTVQWGQRYGIANRTGQPSASEVADILRVASEHGVCTLDTARAYGDSEAVIGRALDGQAGWRVVTKLDPAVDSVAAVERSLGQSREALLRQTLDTLLLHRAAHRHAQGGGLWRALLHRRDRGEVGRLGVSVRTVDEAMAALADADVEVIQVACSVFDQRLKRAGFFARAEEAGKEVHVRSVLLQGAATLEPDALPPHLVAMRPSLRAVREWARHRGRTVVQACVLWARELGTHVILGCETRAQIAEHLAAWSLPPLDDAEVRALTACVETLPEHVVDPAQWPAA